MGLKMSVNDSKLISVIKKEVDIDNMQNWAKTWQISFNYDKCKVMHFGKEEQNTLKLGGLWNDIIE